MNENKKITHLIEELEKKFKEQTKDLSEEERKALRAQLFSSLDKELAVAQKDTRIASNIEAIPEKQKEHTVERFSLNLRFQHLVMLLSIILLIITGIPLKFHETGWAAFVFFILGGINNSAFIHRIGASGLIFVGAYHLLYIIVFKEGRYNFKMLLPSLQDIKNFFTMISYYIGWSKEKAQFDRYSYVEKFDYWAVYWGMIVMIGSGLLLWFHNTSMALFPKFVIDIAREAHSDEGLLATLAIVIWHFYNVHLNPSKFPFNKSMFTGKITLAEIEEEHPLELKRLKTEHKIPVEEESTT